jgi:hypothetical protein
MVDGIGKILACDNKYGPNQATRGSFWVYSEDNTFRVGGVIKDGVKTIYFWPLVIPPFMDVKTLQEREYTERGDDLKTLKQICEKYGYDYLETIGLLTAD